MWKLQVFLFRHLTFYIALHILFINLKSSMAIVTFTNLKCNFTRSDFGEFTKCYIKSVNRTHKYIDIYAKLYELPIDDIKVRLSLMRNDGQGYKPFFFDVTVDACKYLKNPNNLVVEMFYNTFRKYSNLNHTCPYTGDAIVDKLWSGYLEGEFSRYVSVVNGDFAIFSKWYIKNQLESVVNAYVRLKKN